MNTQFATDSPQAGTLEPLRIDFDLRAPMIVPKRPIMLDALLAFVAVRRGFIQAVPGAENYDAQEILPLAKHVAADGAWVWCASALHIEWASQVYSQHRARPFQFNEWAKDRELGVWGSLRSKDVISSGSGLMKGYLIKDEAAHVARCTAWCVGNLKQITDMLGDLVGVGAKVNLGYGRVRQFAVTADASAGERWQRRYLPAVMQSPGLDWALGSAPLRAPYWDRGSVVPAWEPIEWQSSANLSPR